MYQVPPGWSEQRGNGVVTLSFQKDVQEGTSFYGTHRYLLLIFPGRPLRGTLTQTYQALWDEMLPSTFTPTIAPAPMRRRLASGLVCAFDGGFMTTKAGNQLVVVLYVIAAADRVVPVLGLYNQVDDSTEAPLVGFFNALTIRGAKPGKAPLYAPSELVGEWSTMDSSYARYVDSQGHDVGDASITVAQTYRLDGGGTFRSSLVGLRGSGPNVKESHTGTWKIDDDSLVLDAKDIHWRIRIFGIGPSPKSGKPARYLPQSYAGSDVVDFWLPRRNKAEWYGKVTK